MNLAPLIIKPIVVESRLAELGWTLAEMHDIVRSSVAARRGVTSHHPLGTSGYYAWSEASATMRMIGSLKGFYISNENHIAAVYSEKHRAKFVVCNTDGGTGRLDSIPQNRNKKGPGTERDIARNQNTFDFYTEVIDFRQPAPSARGVSTWYICIYCSGDEIRAELSCPVECKDGIFTEFYERIDLTAGGFGDEPISEKQPAPLDDVGFDISVSRK